MAVALGSEDEMNQAKKRQEDIPIRTDSSQCENQQTGKSSKKAKFKFERKVHYSRISKTVHYMESHTLKYLNSSFHQATKLVNEPDSILSNIP